MWFLLCCSYSPQLQTSLQPRILVLYFGSQLSLGFGKRNHPHHFSSPREGESVSSLEKRESAHMAQGRNCWALAGWLWDHADHSLLAQTAGSPPTKVMKLPRIHFSPYSVKALPSFYLLMSQGACWAAVQTLLVSPQDSFCESECLGRPAHPADGSWRPWLL